MTKRPNVTRRLRKVSWRRRALQLARRLGLKVTEVKPGTAVVSLRNAAVKLVRLQSDVVVIGAGKRIGQLRAGPVTQNTWVVSTAADDVDVAKVGTTGWLVSRNDPSPRAELDLETQTLQHLSTRHIAWLLRRYRVDCVLDVGANNGQYAQALRRHGYQGHIVSFEPVPRFVQALEKLAADDDKWSVRQLALGSTEGTVPIHVQRTFSSLLPSSEYGKRRFATLRDLSDTEQVDVSLRRLDGILDELLAPVVASGVAQPRVYLKMDTQGFDLEVFRGLGERVRDIVALQSEVALLLIYEQMPRMPEALAVYEKAGFEISGLYPVTREPDGRVIEYDCTMVRADTLSD